MTGDGFIKLGFWSQLALLVLVDWGTLAAMQAEPHVPWYHYVGFVLVNMVLLGATWKMWTWLAPRRTHGHDAAD